MSVKIIHAVRYREYLLEFINMSKETRTLVQGEKTDCCSELVVIATNYSLKFTFKGNVVL